MQIFNSEAFEKDYEKIQDFLKKSQDDELKKQVIILSRELLSNVKKIDILHSDIQNVRKLSEEVSNIREKIVHIRKKIFSIVK